MSSGVPAIAAPTQFGRGALLSGGSQRRGINWRDLALACTNLWKGFRPLTVPPALLVVAMFLAGCASALAAQDRGSYGDQIACTPDVYRLCSQYIPDEDNIVACLTQRKAQLSPGCKAVFSRPDDPKKNNNDDE